MMVIFILPSHINVASYNLGRVPRLNRPILQLDRIYVFGANEHKKKQFQLYREWDNFPIYINITMMENGSGVVKTGSSLDVSTSLLPGTMKCFFCVKSDELQCKAEIKSPSDSFRHGAAILWDSEIMSKPAV